MVHEALEMIRSLGLQGVVVDAEDDRGVELVLGRGGEDHALGAGVDMLLESGLVGEDAGRFQGDLALELLPGEVGGIALGRDLDVLAVDHEAALGDLDRSLELAVDAVVLEQQGEVLGVREVVDRDDLELLGRRHHRAEDQPTDPTETVDPDSNRHACKLLAGLSILAVRSSTTAAIHPNPGRVSARGRCEIEL